MKKPFVLAIAALLIVGVAGYAGVHFYAQHQAQAAIEQALAGLRATGASARIGGSSLALAERRMVLDDIAITSADGATSLTVKRLTAEGISPPQDGRITARHMTLDGFTLTRSDGPGGQRGEERLPQVMVEDYSGPLLAAPAGLGAADDPLTASLRPLAEVALGRLIIPRATTRVTSADPAVAPIEGTLEGVSVSDLKAGRIGTLTIARLERRTSPAKDDPETGAGLPRMEVADITARDIQLAPLLAPATPGATPQPLVAQIDTGAFSTESEDEIRTKVASLSVTALTLRPGALTGERLSALQGLSRINPLEDPARTRAQLQAATALIESIGFATAELRALNTIEPEGQGRAALVHLEQLHDGQLGEIRFEGMDGDSDGQAVKFGSIALTDLDLSRLLAFAHSPDLTQEQNAVSLFRTFTSLTATDLELPTEGADGESSEPVRIARMGLSWSRPAAGGGPQALPGSIHFELRDASGPIDAEAGEPFNTLAAAGMTRGTFSLVLGASYEPQSQSILIAPAELEVKDAFRLALSGRLEQLPAEALASDEALVGALPQVSLGPFSLTVTDLGLAPLVLERLAAADGVSVEDYRAQLITLMNALIAQLAPDTPQAVVAMGEALARFIQDPKTLVLTATPKGRVPLLALLNSDDPTVTLELFDVTAAYRP